MKQYKKQVDEYKGQVGEMKAEMEGMKTELGVYLQQVMQHREQVGMLTNRTTATVFTAIGCNIGYYMI